MYIAMLMTGWGSQAGEAKVRLSRRGEGGTSLLQMVQPCAATAGCVHSFIADARFQPC